MFFNKRYFLKCTRAERQYEEFRRQERILYRILTLLMFLPYTLIPLVAGGCEKDPFIHHDSLPDVIGVSDFVFPAQIETNAPFPFAINAEMEFSGLSTIKRLRRIDGKDTVIASATGLSIIGAGINASYDSIQSIQAFAAPPDTYLVDIDVQYALRDKPQQVATSTVVFPVLILPVGAVNYTFASQFPDYGTADDSFFVSATTVLGKKLPKKSANGSIVVSKIEIDEGGDGSYEDVAVFDIRPVSSTQDIISIVKSKYNVIAPNLQARISVLGDTTTYVVKLPITRTGGTVITPTNVIITGTANDQPLSGTVTVLNALTTTTLRLRLSILTSTGATIPASIKSVNPQFNSVGLVKGSGYVINGDSLIVFIVRDSVPTTAQLSIRNIVLDYQQFGGGTATYTHPNNQNQFVYSLVRESAVYQYNPGILQVALPAITYTHNTTNPTDSTDIVVTLAVTDATTNQAIPIVDVPGMTVNFLQTGGIGGIPGKGGIATKLSSDQIDRMIKSGKAKTLSFDRKSSHEQKNSLLKKEIERIKKIRSKVFTERPDDSREVSIMVPQGAISSAQSFVVNNFRVIVSGNIITIRYRSLDLTANQVVAFTKIDYSIIDNQLIRTITDSNAHQGLVVPPTSGTVIDPKDTVLLSIPSTTWMSVAGINQVQGTLVVPSKNGGVVTFINPQLISSDNRFLVTFNNNQPTISWTGSALSSQVALSFRMSFSFDSAGQTRTRTSVLVMPNNITVLSPVASTHYTPASVANINGLPGTVFGQNGQTIIRQGAQVTWTDISTGNNIPLTSVTMYVRFNPTGPTNTITYAGVDSCYFNMTQSTLTPFTGNDCIVDSILATCIDQGNTRTLYDRTSRVITKFVPFGTNQWSPVTNPTITWPNQPIIVTGSADTVIYVDVQWLDNLNGPINTLDTFNVILSSNPAITLTTIPVVKPNSSTYRFGIQFNKGQTTLNTISVVDFVGWYFDQGRRFMATAQAQPVSQVVVRRNGAVTNQYAPASTSTINIPGTIFGQNGQTTIRQGYQVVWSDLVTGNNIPLSNVTFFGRLNPSGPTITFSYAGTDSGYVDVIQSMLTLFTGNDLVLDSLRAQFMDQSGLRTVVDRTSRVITKFVPFGTNQWSPVPNPVITWPAQPIIVSGSADTVVYGTVQWFDNSNVAINTLDTFNVVVSVNPGMSLTTVPAVKVNSSTYRFGIQFNKGQTTLNTISVVDFVGWYFDQGRRFMATAQAQPVSQFVVQKNGTVGNQYNPASVITLNTPTNSIMGTQGQSVISFGIKTLLSNLTPLPAYVPLTQVSVYGRFVGGTVSSTINYVGGDSATVNVITSSLPAAGADYVIDSVRAYYTDYGRARSVLDATQRTLVHVTPFTVTSNVIYGALSLGNFPSVVQAAHPLVGATTSFSFQVPTFAGQTITAIDVVGIQASFGQNRTYLNSTIQNSANVATRTVTTTFRNDSLINDPEVLALTNIRVRTIDAVGNTYLYVDSLPSTHSVFVQKWAPLSVPGSAFEITGVPVTLISSPSAVTRLGFRMRLPNMNGGYITYSNSNIIVDRGGVTIPSSQIQRVGADSIYLNLQSVASGLDTIVTIGTKTATYDGGYGIFTDNVGQQFTLRPATSGNTYRPFSSVSSPDVPQTFNGSNQSFILAASNTAVTTDTVTIQLLDSLTNSIIPSWSLTSVGSMSVLGQATLVTYQLIGGNRIVYSVQSSVLNAGPVTLRLSGVQGSYSDYTGSITHATTGNIDFPGYPRTFLYKTNPVITGNTLSASIIASPNSLTNAGGTITLVDSITNQAITVSSLTGTATATGVNPILFAVTDNTTKKSFQWTYQSNQVTVSTTMNYTLTVQWTEIGDVRTKTFNASTTLLPVTAGDVYTPNGVTASTLLGTTLTLSNGSDSTLFTNSTTLTSNGQTVPNAVITGVNISVSGGVVPVVSYSGTTVYVKIDSASVPVTSIRTLALNSITYSYPDYSGQKSVTLNNLGSSFVTRPAYGSGGSSGGGGSLLTTLPNPGDTIRATDPTGIFALLHYDGITYDGGVTYRPTVQTADQIWSGIKDTSLAGSRFTLVNLQTGARDSSVSPYILLASSNSPGANNTYVQDTANVKKMNIAFNGGFISSPATQAIEVRLRIPQITEVGGTGIVPARFIVFWIRRQ